MTMFVVRACELNKPRMASGGRIGIVALSFLGGGAGACDFMELGPPGVGEPVATVEIALQNAPSDVRCIQIATTGAREQETWFPTSPGASTVFTMSGLSAGPQTIRGAAFTQSCPTGALPSTVAPTWVSDSTPVTLVAGTVTTVVLVMRPAANAGINVDFQGGADGGIALGVWDLTNWDNAVWQ